MSEIEKQFFEVFGIKAYYKYLLIDKTTKWHNEKLMDKTNLIDFVRSGKDYLLLKVVKYYPQITDRILLELICILNGFEGIDVKATTVNKLKEELLEQTIEPFKYPIAFEEYHEIEKLYHQVQALFKENN